MEFQRWWVKNQHTQRKINPSLMNDDLSKSDKIVLFLMSKINRIEKKNHLKKINLVDQFLVDTLFSSFDLFL